MYTHLLFILKDTHKDIYILRGQTLKYYYIKDTNLKFFIKLLIDVNLSFLYIPF